MEDRIRTIKGDIGDDDIYDDSLRKFQDSLESLAKIENSTSAMEALHQIVLLRRFLRNLVYEEVEENVKGKLREFPQQQSVEHDEDAFVEQNTETEVEVPAVIITLIRVLDKIDSSQFFDMGYGFVKNDEIVSTLASELSSQIGEEGPEQNNRIIELAQLCTKMYQEEYEEIDKKYKDRINEFFEEILQGVQDPSDIYQTIIDNSKQFKTEVHREHYGWP